MSIIRFRPSPIMSAGSVVIAALLGAALLGAQSPQPASIGSSVIAAANPQPSGEMATLVFFNRPILALRARVFGRSPQDRADTAVAALNELVGLGITGPVEVRKVDLGEIVVVGSRPVFAVTAPDVDLLTGETTDDVAERAGARLRQALIDAGEARRPAAIVRAVALGLVALIAGLLALWGLARGYRRVVRSLITSAEKTIASSGLADLDLIRASRLLDLERYLASIVFLLLGVLVVYVDVTFVLRRFPFTRPWGESMRSFMLARVEDLGLHVLSAMPGLFTAALIALLARFATKMIKFWFDAVEQGRITPAWIYPETAQPTRRLLTVLIWLFATAVAYPFLPGNQSEAFKGISVFLGLMDTLGSSGLVNQIMSGFMITYSRALRVGDFVRVGEVEGTVTQLGVLSTKLTAVLGEEVTVPNAVVITQMMTNYTLKATPSTDVLRPAAGTVGSVLTPTSVTIGYDVPWRQVEALLLEAAAQTSGLRAEPKPIVLQTSLEDFYVKYTLLVGLERPQSRAFTLNALHSHILDVFNEYGVQIMSPNYMLDPAAPKVVLKKDWWPAPARQDVPGPARISEVTPAAR